MNGSLPVSAFHSSQVAVKTVSSQSLIAKLRRHVKSKRLVPPCRWRRGTAVTELAICLPVLTLVIFGSIEMCNVMHLKQTLIEASYEGALVGSQPRATEAEILQRVQTVLTARNIAGANVSIDANGPSFDSLSAGELFTVHVDATVAGNIHVPIRFATFNTVDADVVGHKQE